MAYWLIKSEPETYSIDALRREKHTLWDGVRNYQARNYLMQMERDDHLLFYHSNCKPPGVVGIATVTAKAVPDPSQFDSSGDYFDPRASEESPRWFCPEIGFQKKLRRKIALDEIKEDTLLKSMAVAKRGNRLSVHPVTEEQFNRMCFLAEN